MNLSSIVPWGRSLSEYQEMFALSNDDLSKRILGCGDGPASFNAELTLKSGNVISVDPIYQYDADQIQSRIEDVFEQVMEQVALNQNDYIWNSIPSIESLGEIRMNAMARFLDDYRKDANRRRYLNASLPILPFANKEFQLALCSHYLFLYSEHVDLDHHILSLKELCRVAEEVRVYPLLSISSNQESPHLKTVIDELKSDGVNVSLVGVNYEFQKGANKMLVAKSV